MHIDPRRDRPTASPETLRTARQPAIDPTPPDPVRLDDASVGPTTDPPNSRSRPEVTSGTDVIPEGAETDTPTPGPIGTEPGAGAPVTDRSPSSTDCEASATAPLTFDPSCPRRLRNCVDEANTWFRDGR